MQIQLLPIDNVNAEKICQWHNKKFISFSMMMNRFPVQKKSVEEWIDKVREENGNKRVVYVIFADGTPIGITSLHEIDYINRKALFGIFIAESDFRNKGIGSLASKLTLDFAFNGIGLNRVELEVIETNIGAINMYRKIGFYEEGIKRDAFFYDGKFVNVKTMSILNKDFKISEKLTDDRLIYNYNVEDKL